MSDVNEHGFLPVPQATGGAMAEVIRSKAVQEVQASLIIAKNFPRDVNVVYNKVMEYCKRPLLAQKAFYTYPRGGQTVSGPTIRLLEVLAQCYGNIDSGVRELERRDGVSIAESYCWDLETNTRDTKIFEVPHEREVGKGKDKRNEKVTGARDIYELVANYGARRKRACIEAIIPIDIREAASEQCRKTLKEGGGRPVIDRAKDLMVAFKEHFGVTLKMIEDRLGHALSEITPDEFVDLFGIYNSIKDKVADKSEYFFEKTTIKEINEEAFAKKEAEQKNHASEMLLKKIAELELKDSGWKTEEILKKLGVEKLADLRDSTAIYAALEVLHDA